MKKLLITMLAVMPLTAIADYEVERIKDGMLKSELLKINEWKTNDVGNAWIAKHDLPDTVISVSDDTTGLLRGVANEIDVLSAMGDCMELGTIGLELKDDKQIGDVLINLLKTHKKQTLTMNNVIYQAELIPVDNGLLFTCTLQPEN